MCLRMINEKSEAHEFDHLRELYDQTSHIGRMIVRHEQRKSSSFLMPRFRSFVFLSVRVGMLSPSKLGFTHEFCK